MNINCDHTLMNISRRVFHVHANYEGENQTDVWL